MPEHSVSTLQGVMKGPGKLAVLLMTVSLIPLLTHCTSPLAPQQQKTASVSFAIAAGDVLANPSDASQGRLSALSLHALGFSYTDVKAIRIDVTEKDSGNVLFKNFDLTTPSASEPAAWTGKLTFLPKSTTLVFSATAYGDGPLTPANILFLGSTEQSLSGNNESVVIVLHPSNDKREIFIPRIRKISLPSVFSSDQGGNVSFTVEATTGEKLDYTVAPDTAGGTFYPSKGAITLAGTVGTFVSQYLPPSVTTETTFEHTITVTNSKGHSVTTSFKTVVRPPGSTSGVNDSILKVLFSPVIDTINTRRIGSNVLFTASVSDDPPLSLSYAWSFVADPVGAFPDVTFSGNTNPSSLQNYTKLVQGTVHLSVKDANGNATTLMYYITPEQFPDESDQTVPGALTGVNTLRAGVNHTCVLFNNGNVRCWGLGSAGQLGTGGTANVGDVPGKLPSTAGNVAFTGKALRLAVGGNHACAILTSGLVSCWGRNTYGQLGYNTTENVGAGNLPSNYGYVNLGGTAIKITAGQNHTCALMDTGNVRCWGLNSSGQLGYVNGKSNIGDNEQPYFVGDVKLGDGVVVRDIVAGAYHTCALLQSGAVRCWGNNTFGQLGDGKNLNIGDDETPAQGTNVNLSGGTVLQLAAGSWHTCALLSNGSIRCWGLNSSGQLGYGDTTDRNAPGVEVNLGGAKAWQLALGSDHTCALLQTGEVKCWGYGEFGQLGHVSTTSLSTPGPSVSMSGSSVYQIAAGTYHTCALLSTGATRCWGLNGSGQLGYGHVQNIGDNEPPSVDISL